jgi:hypothetical protein
MAGMCDTRGKSVIDAYEAFGEQGNLGVDGGL